MDGPDKGQRGSGTDQEQEVGLEEKGTARTWRMRRFSPGHSPWLMSACRSVDGVDLASELDWSQANGAILLGD